jgi:hypothetical protein
LVTIWNIGQNWIFVSGARRIKRGCHTRRIEAIWPLQYLLAQPLTRSISNSAILSALTEELAGASGDA